MRSTGDRVYVRRSADDGASWAGWTSAGVTSTNAPSAASSAAGRVDLVTRLASGAVVQSWYRGGVRDSGRPTSVATSSRSTPSRWATAPSTSSPSRRAAWRSASTGTGSAGAAGWPSVACSPPGCRRRPTRPRRRSSSAAAAPTAPPTSASSPRPRPPGRGAPRADGLSGWSDRALGDTWPGVARLAVGAASDGRAVVQRGSLVVATTAVWTSAGDLVSRPDGSFLMAGRGSDGALWVTDGGPSSYAQPFARRRRALTPAERMPGRCRARATRLPARDLGRQAARDRRRGKT